MCRAGGRRCEHGWSEDKRRADNARRRLKYAAKKGGAVRVYSRTEVPTYTVSIPTSIESENIKQLFETAGRNVSPYYQEELAVVKNHLALSGDTPLAVSPAKDYDEEFSSDSSHVVERVVLENGDVGYWKSLSNNEELEVDEDFNVSSAQAMYNEATAYQLAKVLGPEYEVLVPETVIREFSGYIGSFQKEDDGQTFTSWAREDRDRWKVWSGDDYSFKTEHVRAAAIFDYLAGSQDRHSDNVLVGYDKHGKPHPVLIDNGYSFPSNENFWINDSIFTQNVEDESPGELTEREVATLQSLYDSEDSKGLKSLMSEDSYTHFRTRLFSMLSAKRYLDIDAWNNDRDY